MCLSLLLLPWFPPILLAGLLELVSSGGFGGLSWSLIAGCLNDMRAQSRSPSPLRKRQLASPESGLESDDDFVTASEGFDSDSDDDFDVSEAFSTLDDVEDGIIYECDVEIERVDKNGVLIHVKTRYVRMYFQNVQ